MMYRRQMHSSTRSFSTVAAKSEGGSGSIAKFFAMVSKALMDQAWRENRRYDRVEKRHRYHNQYAAAGLNGARAVERRRRQIARGQLKAENGLVA